MVLLPLFCWLAMQISVLYLSLGTPQCIDRAVATSISQVTAKAGDMTVLALMTSFCMLDFAELTK